MMSSGTSPSLSTNEIAAAVGSRDWAAAKEVVGGTVATPSGIWVSPSDRTPTVESLTCTQAAHLSWKSDCLGCVVALFMI